MKTQLSRIICCNLRLLIVEVATQVSSLQHFIAHNGQSSHATELDRHGYTFNLKIRIHSDCYQQMLKADINESETIAFRSIDNISTHLERIAELCSDCIHHVSAPNSQECVYSDDYLPLLDCVAMGISLIERAILERDSQLALKIGDAQQILEDQSQCLIDKCSHALKKKNNTAALVSAMFVANTIKNMGDALRKICEAILSSNLGQDITIDRYHSLTNFVDQLQKKARNQKFTVETIAETRSGSAISGISKENDEDIIAIFKDGKKHKLKEELHNVKSWHEIHPGIAPKILSYRKQGRSAALLIEYLQGTTFETILLKGSDKLQKKALQRLTSTLDCIWRKTLCHEEINANYMQQLLKRLPSVYALHPDFQQSHCRVAGVVLETFDKLLKKACKLERTLPAPFSVYIHGDFNTDNIIYETKANKINFIDLHRSRYMDYLQDISVFMVSNYRLQTLNQIHRRRVLEINLAIYHFAADFARRHGDINFDRRLALGLARSLATSTRFTLDNGLAKAMFYRSRYLIEQLLRLKSNVDYQAPIKEIFVA